MDQLIVTKWKDRSLTALLSDGHCRSLTLESGDESLLGNIYIGKVKNVVKNINAAFIDLERKLVTYPRTVGLIRKCICAA